MPSPIAHVSAACILFQVLRARAPGFRRAGWFALAVLAVLSLLPDADSALGFATGDLGRYHNNLTHSLFVGLGVAAAVGIAARAVRPTRAWLCFLVVLACYELHVVMDFFTIGRGVMALWPFTARRFASPVKLFFGLHWSQGFVSPLHIVTGLSESAVGLLAIVLAQRLLPRRPQA